MKNNNCKRVLVFINDDVVRDVILFQAFKGLKKKIQEMYADEIAYEQTLIEEDELTVDNTSRLHFTKVINWLSDNEGKEDIIQGDVSLYFELNDIGELTSFTLKLLK